MHWMQMGGFAKGSGCACWGSAFQAGFMLLLGLALWASSSTVGAQSPYGPDGCQEVPGTPFPYHNCNSPATAYAKASSAQVPPNYCQAVYAVPNGRVLVRHRSAHFEKMQQCVFPHDPNLIYQEITVSWANYAQGTQSPIQPDKADGSPDCCGVGNPINVVTGQKFEEATDFSMDGLLEFRRYYGSGVARSDIGMGPRWTFSFSRRVVLDSPVALRIVRDDNKTFQFSKSDTSGAWYSDSDVTFKVEDCEDATASGRAVRREWKANFR